MSQHHFETEFRNSRVDVVLGWDRPLRHFFLWVERCHNPAKALASTTASGTAGNDDDVGQDFDYHNLDDLDSHQAGLDYFRDKLQMLGIQVPEVMFDQVLVDCEQNIGNRYVVYNSDGSFHG
jgi:hypothetical protein